MNVAVCFPCWNQRFYTEHLVASVRRNSAGHNVKLVSLDNGSTDGTGDYLQAVSDVFLRLPRNIGVNPAWNLLLGTALGMNVDMIVLVNNDVIVGPAWLDAPARELARDDNWSYFLPNGEFTKVAGFDESVRSSLPALAGRRAPGRAGWCLFFTPAMVRWFHPLPHELVLWFGDDWMHYKLNEHGYSCEVLMDSCALHFVSKTVGEYPDMVATIERDRQHFRSLTGMDV